MWWIQKSLTYPLLCYPRICGALFHPCVSLKQHWMDGCVGVCVSWNQTFQSIQCSFCKISFSGTYSSIHHSCWVLSMSSPRCGEYRGDKSSQQRFELWCVHWMWPSFLLLQVFVKSVNALLPDCLMVRKLSRWLRAMLPCVLLVQWILCPLIMSSLYLSPFHAVNSLGQ